MATATTELDSLPRGTSIDLATTNTRRGIYVASCAKIIRQYYFPDLKYLNCLATRGICKDLTSVLTEDESALVIYWYKNERPRKIYFSSGKKWLEKHEKDIDSISALVYGLLTKETHIHKISLEIT